MEELKQIGLFALMVATIAISLGNVLKQLADKKQQKQMLKQNSGEEYRHRVWVQSVLKKLKIFYNPTLPLFIGEEEVKLKSKRQVLERAVILSKLCELALKFDGSFSAEELSKAKKTTTNFLIQHNLFHSLSPLEKEFLKAPTKQMAMDISWQIECVLYFAFTLKELDVPPLPVEQVGAQEVIEHFTEKPIDELEKEFGFQDLDNLLKWNDMYFNMQWACLEAQLKNKKIKLNPEITRELFKASIWVISDEEWDDIDTSA